MNTPVQVVLVNQTRHQLHAEAHAHFELENRPVVRVVLTQTGVDPLEKELAETRAVLGDVMQENFKGRKMYVVQWKVSDSQREPLFYAYLSVEAAKRASDGREGTTHQWTEGDSHGQWWEAGRYLITEHEIG